MNCTYYFSVSYPSYVQIILPCSTFQLPKICSVVCIIRRFVSFVQRVGSLIRFFEQLLQIPQCMMRFCCKSTFGKPVSKSCIELVRIGRKISNSLRFKREYVFRAMLTRSVLETKNV